MQRVADVRTVVLRSIWLKVLEIRKYLWPPNIYQHPCRTKSKNGLDFYQARTIASLAFSVGTPWWYASIANIRLETAMGISLDFLRKFVALQRFE